MLAPAVGLVVRVAFAFSQGRRAPGGDAFYFHHQANLLADGKGFVNPLLYLGGDISRAAADHPPLYSVYLAIWSLLGADSVLWHRIASAVLGTATVVLVTAAGRTLGGRRVGLLAGTAAALHPNLWLWDGRMLSESASAFTVGLFAFVVVRFLEVRSPGRLIAVGAAVGLAALARSEMALLVLALVPMARLLPPRAAATARSGTRAGAGVLAALAALAVVLPWSAYNQTRFDHPVPLSTGAGLVLVSSNCDLTYSGDLIGYWSFICSVEGNDSAGTTPFEDASTTDRKLREVGVDYARDNVGRLPLVAIARLGRVTGVYRPIQQTNLLKVNEGVPQWVSEISIGTWYVLAVLAVVGGRALRRARVPISGMVAPVVVVLVVAVAVYGIWRFRAPGDVAVCLLAGVGADALVRSRLERGGGDLGGLMATAAGPVEAGPAAEGGPTADAGPAAEGALADRDGRVVRRR